MFRFCGRTLVCALAVGLLAIPAASAQLYVDCSGNTPGAFTTINSALPMLQNGGSLIVTGNCSENVTLANLNNIYFGADWSLKAGLAGTLTIADSQQIFVYGLTVASPTGNGIAVANSREVNINVCALNGNAGNGLNVDLGSVVSIGESGSFDDNGAPGISVGGNSYLSLVPWGGSIDISNNVDAGIYATRGEVDGLGNITISNNKLTPNSLAVSGFGVDMRGAAKGFLLGIFGPTTITQNQSGGISMQEGSELSLAGGALFTNGYPTMIDGNGPIGVSVGFGSQVTFYYGVQVSDHTSVGVDVYANSQAYINGDNQITHNGTGNDPARAGLRLDGNSEAFVRGGTITQNGGPGMLALMNSSFDFSGVAFSGNGGGAMVCDTSSWISTDLPGLATARMSGGACRMPHTLGIRRHLYTSIRPPDVSRLRALADRWRKLTSQTH